MMSLMLDAGQTQILDAVRTYLSEKLPVSRIHHGVDDDGRESWLRDAAAMGWLALGLPEELGGIGCGLVEEAAVAREWGRQLAPLPLLAGVLAAHLAARSGEAALAARIRDGMVPVAFTVGDVADAASGRIALTSLGMASDSLLLILRRHEALLLEPPSEPTHAQALDPSMSAWHLEADLTRPLARLDAADHPLHDHAVLLLSAMMAGVSEGARDMAVAYAKLREQFGRPIGSFQAVAHKCADMALRTEAACCQVAFAALTLPVDGDTASLQVSAAQVVASDAALLNARENVQVHGAMGFTDECDAHLYVKRAHLLELLSGRQMRHARACLDLDRN